MVGSMIKRGTKAWFRIEVGLVLSTLQHYLHGDGEKFNRPPTVRCDPERRTRALRKSSRPCSYGGLVAPDCIARGHSMPGSVALDSSASTRTLEPCCDSDVAAMRTVGSLARRRLTQPRGSDSAGEGEARHRSDRGEGRVRHADEQREQHSQGRRCAEDDSPCPHA